MPRSDPNQIAVIHPAVGRPPSCEGLPATVRHTTPPVPLLPLTISRTSREAPTGLFAF